MGNPSQSYRASLAIWDHTMLPATRHKWTHPALTTARPASTRFTYPGGMEGWVDLGSLIAARPEIEHGPRPLDRPDALTVTPPSHPLVIIITTKPCNMYRDVQKQSMFLTLFGRQTAHLNLNPVIIIQSWVLFSSWYVVRRSNTSTIWNKCWTVAGTWSAKN